MAATDFVQGEIAVNPVVVFSKTTCPYCVKAKRALASVGLAEGSYTVHGESLPGLFLYKIGLLVFALVAN